MTGGPDLTPLYYLVGIGGTLTTGLVATRTYFLRQREKWISEGNKEANLAEKLDSNTKAADKNTAAIEKLSQDMHEFTSKTSQTLNSHDSRLSRLEQAIWSRSRRGSEQEGS